MGIKTIERYPNWLTGASSLHALLDSAKSGVIPFQDDEQCMDWGYEMNQKD